MPASSNDRFVAHEDILTSFKAKRTTLTVENDRGVWQICHIIFHRDGSIFVEFPYFSPGAGIVSQVDFEITPGIISLDLAKRGMVASQLVKYSHHPDGLALLSGDGRVRSEIRRRSFRLDGPSGHLFQFYCYLIDGLRSYSFALVSTCYYWVSIPT